MGNPPAVYIRQGSTAEFTATREKLAQVGKEAAWIATGEILAVVGGAVGVRLLTGRMTPSAYGELALGMTVVALSQQMVFGPLANAVVRFFAPSDQASVLPAYFAAVRRIYLHVFIGVVVVGSCGCVLAGWQVPAFRALAFAATLYALILGCNAGLDTVQNAARQRAVVAWHQALGQWLRVLCAVTAVYLLSPSGTMAMAGYIIAAVAVLASQSLFLLRKFRSSLLQETVPAQLMTELTGKMWAYAWPFALWAPFTWTQSSADRWALECFSGPADVGRYQAMYQIGYCPLALASGFLLRLIIPIVFAKAGDGTDEDSLKAARRLNNSMVLGAVLFTAIAVIVSAILHEGICGIFLAQPYLSESSLLPFFVFAGGIFAAGQILSNNALLGMSPQTLLYPKIGTAVIGGAFTFSLTRTYGMIGTAIAAALFSLVYFAWLVFLEWRKSGQNSNDSVGGR